MLEIKERTPNDYYSFEDLNRIEHNTLKVGLLLKDLFHYDDYLIGNPNLFGSLGGGSYNFDYVYSEDRPFLTVEYYDTWWLKYFRREGYPCLRLISVNVKPSTYYTWSFDVFTWDGDTQITCSHYDGSFYGSHVHKISKNRIRISHTFKTGPNSTFDIFHISGLNLNWDYCFKDFKLEEGKIPTEWFPKNLYEVNQRVLELNLNRDEKSIEFADSLSRLETNINYLKAKFVKAYGVLPPHWEETKNAWLPEDIFSYKDANRLEKNIGGLYNIIRGTLDNYNYCGNYNCGEGVRI